MKVIDAATAAESPEDVLWVGTSWKMTKTLAEGRACITQAAAWLDQQGAEGADRAATLLDRAEALIAQTGGIILRQRLAPVAARLERIAAGRKRPEA